MNVEDNFTVGYLDYPNKQHRPQAGTEAETQWARGWNEAQRMESANPLIRQLNFEAELGRDTFAANYVS